MLKQKGKRKCRNKLNSLVGLAKWNYYADLLEEEKNNMRNTQKVINSIICPKKNTCTDVQSGLYQKIQQTETATEFNNYFANIGPKLASQFIIMASTSLLILIKATCLLVPLTQQMKMKFCK